MRRLFILVSLTVGAFSCASPSAKTAAGDGASDRNTDIPGSIDRIEDPVVVLGAQLSQLQQVDAGSIVAFSRVEGAWVQVPVQVDERVVQDFCEIYGKSSGRWGSEPACKTNRVVEALFYADPETFTGPDTNPAFDADDELVFMARDGGDRVVDWSAPEGVVAGSGVELSLLDDTDEAWIYLFERQDPGLEPGAGRDYVRYQLSLHGIDYKTEYDLYGYNCGGDDGRCEPSMTEDSVIEGAVYSRHFAARWVTDRLQITAGDATGVDILDLHQSRFGPDSCGRHVLTYSTAEGAFVANKDGPVRAIRSYLGANSGPLTQRDHHFYDHREDIVTHLRVHAISKGLMDLFDYSEAAVGMTYFNDLNPDGLTIDGVPDAANDTAAQQWELVTGPQGSLVMTGLIDVSFDVSFAHFFWADERDPSYHQCNTSDTLDAPDSQAFGTSGTWLDGPLPDTDPKNGSSDHSMNTRVIYFQPPGLDVASAQALAQRAAAPVAVRTRPIGLAGTGEDCGDGTCGPGEDASCALDCLPVDGSCGDTLCLPPETSAVCPADCGGSDEGVDDCGDGVCDGSVENELSCASDCWPAYTDALDCAERACDGLLDACADEAECVELVVCVADCVATGSGATQCISDCATTAETPASEVDAATELLVCGSSSGCF